ncbi:glycosyltransferase [Psychrobacter urativorans]|uniref:Glycosyl transferase family 1 n=1 Tax=Psychrobacter urativorans TaxID=45610 RepID=A0A0M4T0Q6_9GAMM|nr:glycosyltransferase [Psychrobacter urativorans]ALF58740.1 glycosyl transferase family 1 [Psychrobacter urativorans]
MSQRKNIVVLIINCLQGGGAERSVLSLGQGFHEIGYQVHIIRFKPLVEYDLNPRLNYHLIKFKPYKLIPSEQLRHKLFARKLDRYILEKIGQPDIILSNLQRSDSVVAYSSLPNITHIIHNTISLEYKFNSVKNINHVRNKLINTYSNHPCVCVSDGVKRDFIESLGAITPITTIHNPIDQSEIQQLSTAFVPKYNNYMIHVGSFKAVKCHNVLLRAYAKTNRSLPLLLLGQGKLQSEIEKLIIDLGLAEKVFLLGFQKNAYPYMKHAKFKILTSSQEGLPMVILEALAIGTPVISTDCQSGPKEMLPENNLMPVGNIDAIAKKMSQAIQNPEQFSVPFDAAYLPHQIAKKHIDFMNSVS